MQAKMGIWSKRYERKIISIKLENKVVKEICL